jgi:hypothetical protein
MTESKREPIVMGESAAQTEGFALTKVYWARGEKEAFAAEARGYGQRESEYARFILNARREPMLFLQLCRLRDPAFAAGLMGNPADAGRVTELEKRALEASHEADALLKERAELEKRTAELERQLADATDRTRDLAAQVVDLARIQDAARERSLASGTEYETTGKPFLAVVTALRIAGRMTKKDLENALVEESKLSPADAASAVQSSIRLGLVVRGADSRYRLAKNAPEADE